MPITINGAMSGKFNVAETMGTVHNDVIYEGRQRRSIPVYLLIIIFYSDYDDNQRAERASSPGQSTQQPGAVASSQLTERHSSPPNHMQTEPPLAQGRSLQLEGSLSVGQPMRHPDTLAPIETGGALSQPSTFIRLPYSFSSASEDSGNQ